MKWRYVVDFLAVVGGLNIASATWWIVKVGWTKAQNSAVGIDVALHEWNRNLFIASVICLAICVVILVRKT